MDVYIIKAYCVCMKKHGLYMLTFGEMCDRFSYYGLQAILVLYLTQALHFSADESYSVYGVYAALGFSSPILGGYIADHHLGEKLTISLGAALIFLGNLCMTQPTLRLNEIGIAVLALGTGLFKPSVTSLLGKLYSNHAGEKTKAYTIFYMGMNTGAILGPICFALLTKYLNWHAGFIVSAAGFMVSLAWFLSRIKLWPTNRATLRTPLLAFIIIALAVVLVFILLLHPNALGFTLALIALIVAIYLIKLLKSQAGVTRQQTQCVLTRMIWGIFFFSASLQIGSSLTLFTQHYVNRSVFGWTIPTPLLSSLEPLWIILSAPFISLLWSYLQKRNKMPSADAKIILGLLFAAISFVIFYSACGLSQTPHHGALLALLFGNLSLGLGELLIMPTVMTSVSENIPDHLQSTMMGLWFLTSGFAGYFASLLSKLSGSPSSPLHGSENFAYSFMITAVIMAAATLFKLLLLIRRKYRKLS